MPKLDPRVDAYIAKSAPFAKPILTHIRTVVHSAWPDVEETMKWSFPHFDYKGTVCSMAAFKAHCTFGFWKAQLLTDGGDAGKSREAMGQYGRITSLDDLPDDRTLASLVKKAAALNEAGVTIPRVRKAPKPEVKPPAYLIAALKKNRKALATFEAFPPSHRREYVEWITEAKTDETRQRRVATAVEWMAEGKGRNWKYERA
jgi:uncharacterized protein YdeI (YjbR/CyaY-like superfamily)